MHNACKGQVPTGNLDILRNQMSSLSAVKLPKRIGGLNELAYNLWWSWHIEARELFKSLDRSLWKVAGHNPVKLLQQIHPYRLVAASEDSAFLKNYDLVMSDFRDYMSSNNNWFGNGYPKLAQTTIAYFSLEFAIHNSLPIYAGGLGVLAGDYCKEASDLGLPLVAVGLMYPKGYFRQRISANGWQEEIYEQLNFAEAPITPVRTPQGRQVKVELIMDDRQVNVAVWQVNVGRVNVYLLDTNVEGNSSSDCELSACLYAGDRELRLQQEIALGIGGVRVLRALGINPVVWHANEGHTAFMMLERVRELVERGKAFNEAVNEVRATTVFTTHTPVAAGNDVFSLDLIKKYFHRYLDSLDLDRNTFLKLGLQDGDSGAFNMTVLGLKMADRRNGVSQLHGAVCRRMWHGLWPDTEETDVPIGSVTNGIHVPTWISPQMARLYEKYLSSEWAKKHDDPALWEHVLDIPDEEILVARRWLKRKLISFVQNRVRKRLSEDHVTSEQALAMGGLFDPEVLTLGFSRRFTDYKRAALVIRDVERLKKMLRNDLQPVQIIFAGKAHPNDEPGKHLIRQVYDLAKDKDCGGRIAFIEDYDMHIARYLIHGVDVWLNTPRQLQEASGTSGMKAVLNGVLHLSVLDGWWYEGYNGANGWAIQSDVNNYHSDEQDRLDAEALYRLLEDKVIPLYYEHYVTGMAHGWTGMIKESIRTNVARFSARRMAKEYTEQMYLAAIRAAQAAKMGESQPAVSDADSCFDRPAEALGSLRPSIPLHFKKIER